MVARGTVHVLGCKSDVACHRTGQFRTEFHAARESIQPLTLIATAAVSCDAAYHADARTGCLQSTCIGTGAKLHRDSPTSALRTLKLKSASICRDSARGPHLRRDYTRTSVARPVRNILKAAWRSRMSIGESTPNTCCSRTASKPLRRKPGRRWTVARFLRSSLGPHLRWQRRRRRKLTLAVFCRQLQIQRENPAKPDGAIPCGMIASPSAAEPTDPFRRRWR